MEMEQYMRTLYQDLIKNCHVCDIIAFQVNYATVKSECGLMVFLFYFTAWAKYYQMFSAVRRDEMRD